MTTSKIDDSRAHPRTGASTGVIEPRPNEPASGAQPRRPSRVEIQQAAPIQPGGTIAGGRYRIERLLGVGGMGAVYEATQTAIGRRIALKVVRADFGDDPAMAARFSREAKAAAAVHHPNVVVVHDFGQDADTGQLFMVMELLSGETLQTRLKREGALPPREAVKIAIEVASALAAAHEAGVVHRDLKPDNVFLLAHGGSTPGTLKVLDFGIARILDAGLEPDVPRTERELRPSDAGTTAAGQTLGTPRYMSPEAVARLPVGPPADLYALGAILFEMLTGKPVFAEKEPAQLMAMHLATPAPALRDVAPTLPVPETLEAIVAQLLAKLPTERPLTAGVVRQRLGQIDWTAPTLADKHVQKQLFVAPPEVEVAPIVPRSRLLPRVARLAFVTLLIGSVAAVLWLHRARLEEQRRTAQIQVTHVSSPERLEHPEDRPDDVSISVRTSPAETRMAWDGIPVTGPTFAVSRDGAAHRLEVSAEGYETQVLEIGADRPHELVVELVRSRGRAPR